MGMTLDIKPGMVSLPTSVPTPAAMAVSSPVTGLRAQLSGRALDVVRAPCVSMVLPMFNRLMPSSCGVLALAGVPPAIS